MTHKLIVAALAQCIGFSAGCAAHRAGVDATITGLIAADNAGDLGAIASYYAADAVLLPPVGAPVRGRDAIRSRYKAGLERFSLEVAIKVEETRVAGDLAFSRGITTGRTVWRDGAAATAFEDKYLMILARRENGGWEIETLMWNPVAHGVSTP